LHGYEKLKHLKKKNGGNYLGFRQFCIFQQMNDDQALANSILNKALSKREKKEQRERTPKSKPKEQNPKCIPKDHPDNHVSEPLTNC
jgi:hypothetical protein